MGKAAKRGRPKKDGPREPSGKLSRASRLEIEGASPAQQKRLRDAALVRMADPHYGTEVGRLFIAERITGAEYTAAKRYVELQAAHRRLAGLPSPDPKSPDMNAVQGRSEATEEASDRDAERARAIMADLETARASVRAAGYLAWSTFVDVVTKDRHCGGLAETHWLSKALTALAIHWGLVALPASET